MLIEYRDQPGLLQFKHLAEYAGLVHAVSTRSIGSNPGEVFDLAWAPGEDPAQMRRRVAAVAAALSTDPLQVCCVRQVHGSRVCCIDELPAPDSSAPCSMPGDGDALVTAQPGIVLLIRVADCVPVLLYDPVKQVVAAVHAGWKGTLADITGKTVSCMCENYGCRPSDLLAGIGPSIGPCCFTVGEEVTEQFRMAAGLADCVKSGCDGTRVDLPQTNRVELLRSGLLPHNVEMAGQCTACRLDIFFSHRGEQGKTGRFGLFAGLRS
jgi:YfiH family protein